MPFLLLIPIAIVAGVLLGYFLSDHPPLNPRWALIILYNDITSEGATLEDWKISTIRELIGPHKINDGFIACDGDGRIVFSDSIPAEIRQRIRNVLG